MDSILRGRRGCTDFAGVTCGVNLRRAVKRYTVCILHKRDVRNACHRQSLVPQKIALSSTGA